MGNDQVALAVRERKTGDFAAAAVQAVGASASVGDFVANALSEIPERRAAAAAVLKEPVDAKTTTARREALVEAAIRMGKLVRGSKDDYIGRLEQDEPGTVATLGILAAALPEADHLVLAGARDETVRTARSAAVGSTLRMLGVQVSDEEIAAREAAASAAAPAATAAAKPLPSREDAVAAFTYGRRPA